MIDIFAGEFLISPIPLEMRLGPCSYGCAYCFANLNARTRPGKFDMQRMLNFLTRYQDHASLAALLLRDGYPVCLSNHTDPFCPSNLPAARAVLELLTTLKIPVMLQTKGGAPDDVIAALPPSVWCVTLTSDDDTISRRIEPHAPPFTERVTFIHKLLSAGQTVELDVIPFVPDWWHDWRGALHRLIDAGCFGVWTEPLHFHYRQRDAMTPTERAAIGEDWIAAGMKRPHPQWYLDAFYAIRDGLHNDGIPVFTAAQGIRSAFFDAFRRVYPKTYPTDQDFLNHLHDTGRTETEFVTEREYVDFFAAKLPGGKWHDNTAIIGTTQHNLFWKNKFPPKMSYAELLSLAFRQPEVHSHPAWRDGYAMPAILTDGEPSHVYVDADGLPLVSFQRAEYSPRYKPMALSGYATRQIT